MTRLGVVVAGVVLLCAAGAARAAEADRTREISAAMLAGDLDKAARLADEGIKETPERPAVWMARGMIRSARKEWDLAEADFARVVELEPKHLGAWQQRGVARFMQGKAKEAVADFDRFLELRPEEKPQHWQRGIALYYAGRYEDGAKQFELHKTVNPDDVENAAWHFLCVARWKGVEAARKGLIEIADGADARVPMGKVQEMFAGKATAEDVIAAAKAGGAEGERLKRQLFYAHLYVGLYFEAIGKPAEAKEHLKLAAGEYEVEDYMGGVAKVHVKMLEKK
jgi:lipoprotein NlpI